VPAAILGTDIDAADAAQLRAFMEEALAALGAPDLGVPFYVVERPADDRRAGWANQWA